MAFLNFLKKRGPKFTIAFSIALFLVVILSTVALAGYIYKVVLNTYLATAMEDFYFTSNLLTAEEPIPTYRITHDWGTSNTANISFELRNYKDPLNISNRQVSYTVKAEPVDPAAPVGDISSKSGVIASGGSNGNKNTISFDINNSHPAEPPVEPIEIMVTATSTSPYAKTLQGKFVINPAISYQMAENTGSPVAFLTITLAQSTELTRDVTITWPEGIAPDMTNPIVITAVDAETYDLAERNLTTTLNTAAVYELVFFKDQAEAEYTGVTVTGSAGS